MADNIQITLDLLGERQTSRRIQTLRADLSDPRPAYRDIADMIRKVQLPQFGTQGARGPRGRWVDLSEAYATWKEMHYPGRPILVLTGKMKAAATSKQSPGAIEEIDRGGVTVGIDGDEVPYAMTHQHGDLGRNIPQRQVYDMTDGDQQEIVDIVRRHLLDSARRAGLTVDAVGESELSHIREIMGAV